MNQQMPFILTNCRVVFLVNRAAAALMFLLMLASVSLNVKAQMSAATLAIEYPPAGAVVSPGSSIRVRVGSSTPERFVKVLVAGEEPIGLSDVAFGMPIEFNMVVPQNSKPGLYHLVAIGITKDEAMIESAAVSLHVEVSTLPLSLIVDPQRLVFAVQGQRSYLGIRAKFANGNIVDVSESTKLKFESSDISVVRIESDGGMSAVGKGEAVVVIKYDSAGPSIAIPTLVLRPTLTLSPTSLEFPDQTLGTVSASQSVVIANISNSPVRIRKADASGNFFLEDGCSSTSPLPPSGNCVVRVTFSPSAVGVRSGALSVYNSFDLVSSVVPLRGVGNAGKKSPVLVWLAPPNLTFGTALGASQLKASASVPGAFVYSPSSGSVLPVGNNQVLSVAFTPTDAKNYSAAVASTTINVLPGTSPGVQLIATSVLSRDANKNIAIQITLANAGLAPAIKVNLLAVKIGTSSGVAVPRVVGTIQANSLMSAVVTVPGSVGVAGASGSLTISGNYTGGTFNTATRVTLP